jgi:hypothetical protein
MLQDSKIVPKKFDDMPLVLRRMALDREQGEAKWYSALVFISPMINPELGKAEPPDEYKRNGMLAYADGTNWNPGSGKGFYRYDTDAWVYIG